MKEIYKNILSNLGGDSFVPYSGDERFCKDSLVSAYEACLPLFEDDFDKVFSGLDFIFSDIPGGLLQTDALLSFIRNYLEGDEGGVSMPGFIAAIFSRFSIDDPLICKAALGAALYAEIVHDLPYHNNAHFKKVVLHMARLIVAHNYIFKDTANFLDRHKVALLLIAAVIHDLGHTGAGNIIDRKYDFAKTEQRSLDIIRPFLQRCGLCDDDLSDILTLLIATDVSPFGDPMSPSNQVRRLYEVHFGDNEEESDDAEFIVSDLLRVLESRERLCSMALMLHEADVLNSAAVSYEMTVSESKSVSLEVGRQNALPEDTLLFLEKICNGKMCSAAAQLIGAEAMKDIKACVIDDYASGNKSYL